MTLTALLARLASRGYLPVSHGATDYPENWLDLDGTAGSIRIVTHTADGGRVEVYGLGPRPAGLALFDIRLSGSTPWPVIEAVLNAAETWLAGPASASPAGHHPAHPCWRPRGKAHPMTYQPGDRIVLVHTSDPHTRLIPGTAGTVTSYDARHGQLAVTWDDGSTLAMLLNDGDQVRPLDSPSASPPAGPPPGTGTT